jgi:ABC-type ATPase involved in cell division
MTEHGSNLSQGQRLLPEISRTVLANPDVLILDEAPGNIGIRDATQVLVIDRGRRFDHRDHKSLLARHSSLHLVVVTRGIPIVAERLSVPDGIIRPTPGSRPLSCPAAATVAAQV